MRGQLEALQQVQERWKQQYGGEFARGMRAGMLPSHPYNVGCKWRQYNPPAKYCTRDDARGMKQVASTARAATLFQYMQASFDGWEDTALGYAT
jgi:hypothetical protein